VDTSQPKSDAGVRRNVQKAFFVVYDDENGTPRLDANGETLKEYGGLHIAKYLFDWISESKEVSRKVRKETRRMSGKLNDILNEETKKSKKW